jgi:outer membrane biosynthesis protein TonB
LQQEAARQAALRQENARLEGLKQEALRQDALRQAALKQEALRQEALKQDALRQEGMKQEVLKQEAANQAALKQEAARQGAQQARASDEAAQREERLRAIGRQLDAEAAQRNAASNRPAPAQTPTTSSLRRGWMFGRDDANAELVRYAQAMSRKIEMNMTFELVREAVKQAHTQPIVTVAVRADGSVENITFVVSSGVPAIDAAIRQVVASQAPYARFSPALARQYDVIEIRRSWLFDMAIRLQ